MMDDEKHRPADAPVGRDEEGERVEKPIHAYPPTPQPEIKSLVFNLAGPYGEGMAIAFILGAAFAALVWLVIDLVL